MFVCMLLSIYIFFVLSLSVIVCCVGPAFWGLINPQWNMCSKGRRQSPIDIEPDKLLFDPYLRPLHIDKHKVNPINYFKNAYSTTAKCCTKKRKSAQIQEHRHTHRLPSYSINNALLLFGSCPVKVLTAPKRKKHIKEGKKWEWN